MYDIRRVHRLIQEARQKAGLTQHQLAEVIGTSQSAVAKLEQGGMNPTIDTLERCAEAAGFQLQVVLVPLPERDPVIARYKQDVDRTLLRENLRKSVNERVRTLGEWQESGRELERAVRTAKRNR